MAGSIMDELRAEMKARKDAKRISRLPAMLPGGSSSPTPGPRGKSKSASSSSSSPVEEGFSKVGSGQQISFDDWIARLNRAIPTIGGVIPAKMQIAMAEAVVDELKAYLEEGVDPSLSPFTVALSGDHPALATLANHIKISRPKPMRIGYRPAKDGVPGNPGVFSKGTLPCEIGFETPEWDRIAYFLEHGAVLRPPDQLRKALIAKAQQAGFKLEEDMGSGGYWIVPPRPFSHVLTSSSVQKRLKKIAMDVMTGRYIPRRAKGDKPAWMREYEAPAPKPRFVNIDDLSEVLSADTNDWTDLIEMGSRRSRSRR